MPKPRIINLPEIEGKQGKYSVLEEPLLPFVPRRVYWIYDSVPENTGGNHAHLNADRVLICVNGKAKVHLESIEGLHYDFILDHPSKALYFPRLHWITYTLQDQAILMSLVNVPFNEDVKIADYANFRQRKF